MNQQNEAMIKQTHPSYERLAAALAQRGVVKPSEIAKAFGELQQTVKNWETRGVSRKGAMTAQEVFGLDANWIATGQPPPQPVAHLPTREAPTLAQALEALDAALEPLDSQARRIAVGMLAGLETPRNAQMVAAMLGAAIESSKRRAA